MRKRRQSVELVRDAVGTDPPVNFFWGKLATNVTTGNTVVVGIWQGNDGSFGGWDVYAGYGYTAYLPPTHVGLPAGCPVLIEKINGKWIIVKPHSLWIQGHATAAVATTDATFTIDNVASMVGPVVVAASSDTITVNNKHSWAFDSGALVDAVWNGSQQRWDTIQGNCPA